MIVSRTWRSYQRAITDAILERRIQKTLISDEAQKRLLYHRKLVHLLSETYHNIDPSLAESVVIAHFLHFQYLYFSINYEYLPFTINNETEAKRALRVLEDKSREIVFQLIPDQFDNHKKLDDLYRYLNEHIGKYKKACSEKDPFYGKTYENLVTPLASVLHFPVEIFSLITNDDRNGEVIKSGLNNYFLGKKIVMDIKAFKNDARLGAWNYVQYSFDQKMRREGIDIDNVDATKKARYFFVSGVASDMYDNAISYFGKNIDCWKNLSSRRLKQFPVREVAQINHIIQTMNQLVEKATAKVGVSAG